MWRKCSNFNDYHIMTCLVTFQDIEGSEEDSNWRRCHGNGDSRPQDHLTPHLHIRWALLMTLNVIHCLSAFSFWSNKIKFKLYSCFFNIENINFFFKPVVTATGDTDRLLLTNSFCIWDSSFTVQLCVILLFINRTRITNDGYFSSNRPTSCKNQNSCAIFKRTTWT